ncbi:MAG: hypothetical protein WCV70_00970 [Patescibacteria group bacterium]
MADDVLSIEYMTLRAEVIKNKKNKVITLYFFINSIVGLMFLNKNIPPKAKTIKSITKLKLKEILLKLPTIIVSDMSLKLGVIKKMKNKKYIGLYKKRGDRPSSNPSINFI